jgi:hypothetical protein
MSRGVGRCTYPIWSNKWVESHPTTYKNKIMCSGDNLELLKVLDRLMPKLLQRVIEHHDDEDYVMTEEDLNSDSYVWKEERYWTENSGQWQVALW